MHARFYFYVVFDNGWEGKILIMKKGKEGFSLAEMLIVVAIIGVLIAISIPIFTQQLERSKQASDLANMRNAKSVAVTDWMTNPPEDPSAVYSRNYDAARGIMVDSVPQGYGRSSADAATFASELNAHRIPNDGQPHYVNVTIDPSGDVTLSWGAVNTAYLSAVSPYKGKALMSLKDIPNSERTKADQATLKAIGEEILNKGWTINELKKNLGILVDGSAVRIANFYQLKNGSFTGEYDSAGFKVTGTDQLDGLLDEIGFDGGTVMSRESDQNTTSTTYTNSLFYSDELTTNKFKNYAIEKTMRSIIITDMKTDNNGVLNKFTIYSKAMDEQANMDEAEKARFRISVSKA